MVESQSLTILNKSPIKNENKFNEESTNDNNNPLDVNNINNSEKIQSYINNDLQISLNNIHKFKTFKEYKNSLNLSFNDNKLPIPAITSHNGEGHESVQKVNSLKTKSLSVINNYSFLANRKKFDNESIEDFKNKIKERLNSDNLNPQQKPSSMFHDLFNNGFLKRKHSFHHSYSLNYLASKKEKEKENLQNNYLKRKNDTSSSDFKTTLKREIAQNQSYINSLKKETHSLVNTIKNINEDQTKKTEESNVINEKLNNTNQTVNDKDKKSSEDNDFDKALLDEKIQQNEEILKKKISDAKKNKLKFSKEMLERSKNIKERRRKERELVIKSLDDMQKSQKERIADIEKESLEWKSTVMDIEKELLSLKNSISSTDGLFDDLFKKGKKLELEVESLRKKNKVINYLFKYKYYYN